jgi:phosphoglycolate phosphatase
MASLLGYEDLTLSLRIAEHYKAAFLERRSTPDFADPLFPGARDVLEALQQRDVLMGVATGKAMRGLRSVLARHELEAFFMTLQTADLHPSKPHPSMVLAAMAEAGVAAGETLMVGDTTFDIEMAVAAGVTAVGVPWGNHPPGELLAAGAAALLERFEDLLPMLDISAPRTAAADGQLI